MTAPGDPLLTTLLALLPGEPERLARWVDQLRERVRERFPDVETDVGEFLRQQAQRVASLPHPLETLEALHGADLFLAHAAAQQDPAAIRTLHDSCRAELRGHARNVHASPAFVDEVEQRVLVSLLVVEKDRPKISQYTGRGPLSAWLRAVALGTALNLHRQSQPEAAPGTSPEEELEDKFFTQETPELQCLQSLCGEDFKNAFKEALAQLTPRERNLLRLRYLDGLTGDQLARSFGVNRATINRWMSGVTEALLGSVRRTLKTRLSLSEDEVSSFIRIGRDELNFTLGGLLREASDLQRPRES